MNPDLSGLVIIDAETDRPPPPLRGHPAPTNLRSNSSLEVKLVDPIEDCLEVEVAAARVERGEAVGLLANQWLAAANVVVKHRTCLADTASGIVGNRLHYRFRRVEKHVVYPQLKRGPHPAKAHHRRAVVGYRETNRQPEIP